MRQVLQKQIVFRLNETDYFALQDLADLEELSVSEFLPHRVKADIKRNKRKALPATPKFEN